MLEMVAGEVEEEEEKKREGQKKNETQIGKWNKIRFVSQSLGKETPTDRTMWEERERVTYWLATVEKKKCLLHVWECICDKYKD